MQDGREIKKVDHDSFRADDDENPCLGADSMV